MPTVVQFRRGTTAQNATFTGAAGEMTIDTQQNIINVQDGTTIGGWPLVGTLQSQTVYNKTFPVISGVTVHSGNLVANSATASTSVSTGALVVVGGAGVSGNVTAGNINVNNGIGVTGDVAIAGNLYTNTARIATTSNVTAVVANVTTIIDTFPTTQYRSAKYIVQASSTDGNYQTMEALVLHDGTTPQITVYSAVKTNGNLGVLTANITLNSCSVCMIPYQAATTIRVSKEYMLI